MYEDDPTAGERLDASLLESEQVFRATFDRAVIGIAHLSREGRWLRVNRRLCDLLGYDRAELTARTWREITHPADLPAHRAYTRRLLAGVLDAYELDTRFVRKDGVPLWVHLTVSLVRTPEGVPSYFIAMAQDIAERKRLEKERGQLLQRERATNAQLRALQALTDSALSHLAVDDLLRELLRRVTTVMGADTVCISLLEEDARMLTLQAARGLGEEDVGRVRIPVGRGVLGRVAASQEPLIVDADALSAADLEGVPLILREQLRSVAVVPLLVEDHAARRAAGRGAEGRLVGVLGMGRTTPRRFRKADVQLLQLVGDRVALAVDRARLYAAEQQARQGAEVALARAVVSEAQATVRAAQLHTILETMADGVAVHDAEGHPVQTNRAYRVLLAADHLPGFDATTPTERGVLLDMRDSITGAPLPPERIATARALAGEVVSGPSADGRVRALDGRELEVNASAAPLRDPHDGRIVGVVSVVRDVTERNGLAREREAARADELAAREASRRMEQFLATAAHDLRTPLTTTIGYLALAERTFDRLGAALQEEPPHLTTRVEDVRHRLQEAEKSAARLARLLTLLFDTAAVRADKLELHRAPGDLAALVREQVAAQKVAAPGRTIRLRLAAAPEAGGTVPVIPVEADADRIGQVVTNYLTNALKYSPRDQPVDVSVAVRGGQARVAVRDRGPGLPEAERTPVWEPFHRAPGVEVQSAARGGVAGGSLGLGLHICKTIVEAHGGQVGVESAVGQGSTFWFTLPLAGAPLASPLTS